MGYFGRVVRDAAATLKPFRSACPAFTIFSGTTDSKFADARRAYTDAKYAFVQAVLEAARAEVRVPLNGQASTLG
jgi:hypothetical protein